MSFIDVCLLIYDDKFHSIMICPFVREMVSISCRPVWHTVNKFAYIDGFVNYTLII